VKVRRANGALHLSLAPAGPVSLVDRSSLREEAFLRVIGHERKRAERSGTPSVLMLIEMETQFPPEKNGEALEMILSELAATIRETDVTGWYKDGCVVGVMFTGITLAEGSSVVTTVIARVSEALRSRLSSRQVNQVSIVFHLFPEEGDEPIPTMPGPPLFCPDLASPGEAGRLVES
jgi:hypothetical protein